MRGLAIKRWIKADVCYNCLSLKQTPKGFKMHSKLVLLSAVAMVLVSHVKPVHAHKRTGVTEEELADYAATCNQAQFNYRMDVFDRLGVDADWSVVKMPMQGFEFEIVKNGKLQVCPKGSTREKSSNILGQRVSYHCYLSDGREVGAIEFTPQVLNTVDDRKVNMVRYLPSCNAIVGYLE